jgi:hypothetical protein
MHCQQRTGVVFRLTQTFLIDERHKRADLAQIQFGG